MSDSARENERIIGRWLAVWAAMVGILVLIGGATRLTESGLSITEWQPFSGVIPPVGDAQWTAEFAKYQQIPQYKLFLLNHGMSLPEFKTIFLWEYIHRLWGRMLGVVLVLIWFVNRKRIKRKIWPRLLGLLVLLGLQGALGWWMVMSGLSVRTSVSQYRLAAHLLTALALYAFTVWTAAELIDPRGIRAPGTGKKLTAAAIALAIFVPITAASGAFVAGLHAGKIYNTFPLMGAGLVPAEYSQLQPFWRNLFENPAAVQFNHRLIATTTLVLALCVWFFARHSANTRVVRASRWVLAAALVQITLGISTLLTAVPVPLGIAHQAGAVLLLTASLLALHANGSVTSPLSVS